MPWYVFPIKPGTKEPAFVGWQDHSTDNAATVEAWREAGYDLAVDCGKSGLLVVDPDGEAGLATAAGMDLPPTYTMQTPRGGKHLYYQGEGPSSVQKLGTKVDTRGVGGYVVWEADGYDLIEPLAVAPLPAWVVPALHMRKDRKTASVADLDLPANIRRAQSYLEIRRPAVEGEGGNDHTYQTASALRDLGISADTATELMLDGWNERCTPPWDTNELGVLICNAYRYGQNEEGAQALNADPASRFSGVAYEAPLQEEKPARFRLWSVSEARQRPKPSWLFPNILPARSVGLVYGAPDAGKTWLVLNMALCLATGRGLDGTKQNEPKDVVYFTGEGFDDLVQGRINAWCDYHGEDGQLPHFQLLEDFPNVADDDDVDLLSEEIFKRGFNPDLILLDTYARVMGGSGLNENDPLDVMKFVGQAEILKRRHQTSVLPIHHSGKDIERQARGSNALMGAVDFAYEVTADWSVMALKLSCARMKAAKRFDPLYYEALPHDDSLVVRGITSTAYHALTRVEDSFNSRNVGTALAKLGATDSAHAVSVHVLASALYTAEIGEPEQEVQAKIDRIARKLTALGKGRLEQYVGVKGWAFPE